MKKKINAGNNLRVPYAQAVYGKREIKAVEKVLSNPLHIVAGDAVRLFENKIARLFGKKYGIMVNSGSSANLLAISLLGLPKGSEVITPILTFSTTLAPLVQKGLVPVFVDVEPGTYLIDVKKIESRITKKTKALMIPSLLGNIPDLRALRNIAKKHHLRLIEDSCDTLGATFSGKPTGFYSHISTTSFYAPHIITAAGGGGMICVADEKLQRRARVMAYWGRESTLFGAYEKSEEIKKRFSGRLGGRPYDAKFIFSELGYNFQPTEISGAFGLEQLKRLKKFSNIRRKNFQRLHAFFKKYEDIFILPHTTPEAQTAWLAFPLTIRTGVGFSRYEITKYLEERNIQTRPIFTGNVLVQPAFRNIKAKIDSHGYPVANFIMKNGFLVGCHQGLEAEHLDYLEKVFEDFLSIHAKK